MNVRANRRIDSFLDMLVAERGASANTLSAYRTDLDDLASFLIGCGRAIDAAQSEDLRAWLADLSGRGFAATSIARRLSAARQFHRFLQTERVRTDDPTLVLEGPRRVRSLPKVLSIDDMDRLLSTARLLSADPEASARRRLAAARLVALVEVAYASGLRVSELVSLPVSATRGERRMIIVRGKGGKERLVPLSQPARDAMSAYMALLVEAGVDPDKSPWAFPTAAAEGHLTRQQFGRDLKDLAIAAGLPPQRLSPHVLRHAFASHLLSGGADLRIVQTLLGHADIATTEIYTHVMDDRLASLVRDAHPLMDDVRGP